MYLDTEMVLTRYDMHMLAATDARTTGKLVDVLREAAAAWALASTISDYAEGDTVLRRQPREVRARHLVTVATAGLNAVVPTGG